MAPLMGFCTDVCYENAMEQILYESDGSMDHDQIWPGMLWNCIGLKGLVEYNSTCISACVEEADDVDDHCDSAGAALPSLPSPVVTTMR